MTKAGNAGTQNGQSRTAVIAVLLLTFLCYLPALRGAINLWDDYFYIEANAAVTGCDLPALFSGYYLGNYQPLTLLSFAIDYLLFGLKPLPWHLENVFLHLANTWLVFLLITKLTSNRNAALITALLFALHPTHVESVAWVSGRKDVIYTLFFLLGLLSYLCYRDDGQRKHYLLTALFFVLSCLAKAMSVVFPVVLLLTDHLLDGKFTRRRLLPVLPFFLPAAIFGLIALDAQEAGGATGFTESLYTASDKFFLANYSFFHYIQKMFLPIDLSVIYPYPNKLNGTLPVIHRLAPLFNVLFIVLTWLLARRSRNFLFGALFFVVTIFPVLQILSVGSAIAADRYFYLSSVGLFLMAGIFTSPLGGGWRGPSLPLKGRLGWGLIALAAVLGYLTFERTKVWADNEALWTDAIAKQPQIEFPYHYRGIHYYNAKQYDKALQDFSRTLQINPVHIEARDLRSKIFFEQKDYKAAIADQDYLLQAAPDNVAVRYARGLAKAYVSDFAGAVADWTQVISLQPDYRDAYHNRGNARSILGDAAGACSDWRKALSLGHTDAGRMIRERCN